jgi:prepilin-type N-terminal cleavage/methylation domain-containing protein/prepilin-type processing-associated H-X9-DG protein
MRRGFTLIELLVVIVILAILATLVTGGVRGALARSQAAGSLSNLRQWGVGATSYADDNDDWMPWDGEDNVASNFGVKEWWANGIPPYLAQLGYKDVTTAAAAGSARLPLPPTRSIFIDPSAKMPANAPYRAGAFRYFFCYVPNSAMNSSVSGAGVAKRLKMGNVPQADRTAHLVEMRTVPQEIPENDPWYGQTLDRAKANWKRFAGRHNKGGHILFVDGHAAWLSYKRATAAGSGGDNNNADVIWNPLGPAT